MSMRAKIVSEIFHISRKKLEFSFRISVCQHPFSVIFDLDVERFMSHSGLDFIHGYVFSQHGFERCEQIDFYLMDPFFRVS